MNEFAKQIDYILNPVEVEQDLHNGLQNMRNLDRYTATVGNFLASLQHFGYGRVDMQGISENVIKALHGEADPDSFREANSGVWFKLAHYGLPLLLLYGTEEQIQTFVSPYHLKLDPGYTGRFERNYTRAYLLMCNFLKSTPEPDAGLRQELLDCKKKQVVLLVEALLAAVEGTQSDFDRAFTAGMKYFRSRNKTYKDNDKKQFDLIALEYTAVNAIAKRCGKHMTELPINLACSILTRESIDNPVP